MTKPSLSCPQITYVRLNVQNKIQKYFFPVFTCLHMNIVNYRMTMAIEFASVGKFHLYPQKLRMFRFWDLKYGLTCTYSF